MRDDALVKISFNSSKVLLEPSNPKSSKKSLKSLLSILLKSYWNRSMYSTLEKIEETFNSSKVLLELVCIS